MYQQPDDEICIIYRSRSRPPVALVRDTSKSRWVRLSSFVLMEWTGRTDRNGTDIYEGDIVRSAFGVTTFYWSNDNGCYMFNLPGIELNELGALTDGMMEVIGNLYRDPELIKDLGKRRLEPDSRDELSSANGEQVTAKSVKKPRSTSRKRAGSRRST